LGLRQKTLSPLVSQAGYGPVSKSSIHCAGKVVRQKGKQINNTTPIHLVVFVKIGYLNTDMWKFESSQS